MGRKRLAILGGGPEQIVAVRTASVLGYETVVVDDDPEAAAREVADIFINTRIKEVDGLIEALELYKISGVMTHAAELAVETARVALAFGLPGLSVESAELGTYKHLRIRRFEECGLNIPAYVILKEDDTVEEWKRGAVSLRYPVVAKPTGGKGALGVLLIKNEADLVYYYNGVKTSLGSEYYIIEEYLQGLQLSTETVLSKGRPLRHNIAYRHYEGMERDHPYLIEDGHSMPVDIEADLRARIEAAIEASASALGVEDGVVKGDLLVDKDGTVYIIEMAARSSGGRFADFVTVEQCGVNILYAMVQMAMGGEVDRNRLAERFSHGVSQRFIFLEEGAVLEEMPELDDIRSTEGLLDMVFSEDFKKELTQERITSHQDRIGYVICGADERGEADRLALEVCNRIIDRMKGSR